MQRGILFCLCYATIHKEARVSKFDPRAFPCVYLGLTQNHRGFKVRDLRTGKKRFVADAVFIKTVFPYRQRIPGGISTFDFELGDIEPSWAEAVAQQSAADNWRLRLAEFKATKQGKGEGKHLLPIKHQEEQILEPEAPKPTSKPQESPKPVEEGNDQPMSKEPTRIMPSRGARPDYAKLHTGKETALIVQSTDPDPQGWEEALQCEDADEWIKAGEAEIQNHQSNSTWILVDRAAAAGKKIFQPRTVFKRKWLPADLENPKGKLDKNKVRITIAAFKSMLQDGVDFRSKYAATPRWNSIRLIFAIVAYYDLEMDLNDITAFFLTADLEDGEEIYMEQPARYDDGSGRICKLQRSMYGLPQASYHSQKKLNGIFLKDGFRQAKNDRTIFFKHDVEGKLVSVMAPHVDDILAGGTKAGLSDIRTTIGQAFKFTTINDPTVVTGVQIERNREKRWLKIHQEGYVLKLLTEEQMLDSHPTSTPIVSSIVNTERPTASKVNNSPDREQLKARAHFQKIYGSLLWLAVHTRPDLSFACNFFGRWLQVAGVEQLKWIRNWPLKYLNGTRDYGIVFQAGSHFDRHGASDSDFAGDITTSRSTLGWTTKVGEYGTLSYNSKLDRKIFSSVGQAETAAAVEWTKDEHWTGSLMTEMGITQEKATTLEIDNAGVQKQAVESVNHARAKHYRVGQAVIKQLHDDGDIFVKKVDSNSNRADFFTKALDKTLFEKHRHSIMGPQKPI